MNFLEILGICFLSEIVVVLSLSIWTFVSILIGKKARLEREKLLNKLTSSIIKKEKSISDYDESIIEKAINNQHTSSDQTIAKEIYNAENDDKEKEIRKQQFFDALNNSKQSMDAN